MPLLRTEISIVRCDYRNCGTQITIETGNWDFSTIKYKLTGMGWYLFVPADANDEMMRGIFRPVTSGSFGVPITTN